MNDHEVNKIPSHFPRNLSRSNRPLLWEVNQPTRLEKVLPRNCAKILKIVDFHMDFPKVFFTTTKKSDKSGPWVGVACVNNLKKLGTATKTCYAPWRSKVGSRTFWTLLNHLIFYVLTRYLHFWRFMDIFPELHLLVQNRHPQQCFHVQVFKDLSLVSLLDDADVGKSQNLDFVFWENLESLQTSEKSPCSCWFGWNILIDFLWHGYPRLREDSSKVTLLPSRSGKRALICEVIWLLLVFWKYQEVDGSERVYDCGLCHMIVQVYARLSQKDGSVVSSIKKHFSGGPFSVSGRFVFCGLKGGVLCWVWSDSIKLH